MVLLYTYRRENRILCLGVLSYTSVVAGNFSLAISVGSSCREAALQTHNLRSCGPFFVEFDGESTRSKFAQKLDRRPKMAEKSRVTKTWPLLHHWCWASRIGSTLRNGLEFDRLLRWFAYELIPADLEHFESLS